MELGQKGQQDSSAPLSQVGWRHSLVTRMGGSLLLLTGVFLALLGIVLIWTARQAQRESIFVQQRKSAREAALLISSYIGDAMNELSLFETMQPLATLTVDGQKSAVERLLIYRRTLFSQITLLDKNGAELVKVSDSHTFMPGELGNRAGTEAFAQAMQGESYIGTVFVSQGSGLLSVEIAVPVKATQGGVAGVLVAEVKVVRLWQEVSRIEIGQTGYAYLVDTQGRFIAYQEPGEVLQRHGEDMKRMPPVQDYAAGKQEEIPPVYEYVGLNDQRVVGVSVPVPDTSWAAVVELPTQEAYASVERMQWYLIGLTALGVVAAAWVGFAVSRRILQPIRRLTASTLRIGAGDLEVEVAVPRQMDEVGLLARSFRQMQGELKTLYGGLERQVAERTRDLERRSAYLQASAEVSRAAASILETDQLIRQVVELIRERFGLYYVGLFMLDAAGEWATLRAGTGEAGQAMLARGHRLSIGGSSMISWCIAHAQARIALEVGEDAVRLATPELPQTRSEAALPLRSRDKMVGALTVQSDRPGAFDQDAITVLQTMADLVATALDNARLFQQAQEATEAERRSLGELSRQAWQQTLRARPDLGVLSNAQATVPAGDLWRPELKTALRAGEMATTDTANAVAIPIKVRGQVIGVVGGRKPGSGGQWTAEEIALMQTLTEQLSTALESARLYQDTQRRAARERLVGQVTSRVRETLDMETMLKTAADEMRQALGLERLVVRLGAPEPDDRPKA